jgi:hypothetical protein
MGASAFNCLQNNVLKRQAKTNHRLKTNDTLGLSRCSVSAARASSRLKKPFRRVEPPVSGQWLKAAPGSTGGVGLWILIGLAPTVRSERDEAIEMA